MTRVIEQLNPVGLGELYKGKAARKMVGITKVEVADSTSTFGMPTILLCFTTVDNQYIRVNLKKNIALQIAKGILERTPDVSIHVDEELQSIIAEAISRSDVDAKAVVDAVRRNNTPPPKEEQ